jgi:hypothetical protein
MKKLPTLVATFLLISFFAFSSCRKCSICVVKDKATGNQITSSDEMCGSSSEVTDMENEFKKQWEVSNDVTCSSK